MSELSMQLPAGKTCGDCVHLRRCKMLFGCKPENVVCDFAPSRFTLSALVIGEIGGNYAAAKLAMERRPPDC